MLKRLKIRQRLLLGYVAIALLVAAVSVFCYNELIKVLAPLTKDIPQGLDEIETTSRLDSLAQRIRYFDQVLTQSAREYATKGERKWKDRYKTVEPQLDQSIKEAIERGDDQDKLVFSEIQKAKLEFVDLEVQALAAADRGEHAHALSLLESPQYWMSKEEYKDGLEKYAERRGKKLGESLEVTAGKVDAIVNATHVLVQRSIRALVVITGVALALAVMLGLFVSQSLVKPIYSLQKGAEIVGKGYLDYTIKVDSEDEIGALASSFNDMTFKLKESYSGLEEKVKEKTAELTNKVQEIERQNLVLEETKRATLNLLEDLEVEKAKVERAHRQLEEQAKELKRSNEELEQFAYVASHDLQEPLRMVASYTQLLGSRYAGKLDKDADEFIAFAVDGVGRMQRLIKDLLAYSRVGSKGEPFETVPCEDVLSQALDNLQVAVKETKAAITHDPLPKVSADSGQLVQLFQNLIGNALKFCGEKKPRVHVGADQDGASWVFSVRDNGVGIDPQFADRIFAIFQRLHHDTKIPGTGIGLAVCKKIVERHGGRIWVESEVGKGACFYFTIPARSAKAVAA